LIDISCVIFAGGKSSRMKTDKSLLPFGGYNTLAQFQYERLSKIFKKVYISTKDSKKFDFNANFIEENSDVFAPTAGFVEIFKKLDDERFFVISVDSPFISLDIISKIYKNDSLEVDVTIAKSNEQIEPMCAIYHRSLKNKFETMLKEDNHKLGILLNSSNVKYIEFKDSFSFKNLNYPNEYKEAKKYEFNTFR